eukprot:CAMPEP_0170634508 /NCGR_PEP_ID=MMETSP0224-20130122/36648_1 /TAXON_ID=285029 /ORGANISM="Togula jolla, Strain CCCM 725" /LENGTH=167 /DNA_ID=CAMNT_0010963791 /DNA_START=1 /DNA_END=501 /DNA_ORIENTATION=-
MADTVEIDSDVEEVAQEETFDVDMEDELKDEELDETGERDPERLPREKEPFPPLPAAAEVEPSGARAKVLAKIQHETEQQAGAALGAGNSAMAVQKITEAMRTGGSTALLLATRAAILLKQRRPCAAIRDCCAALKINSLIVKAYRIRGIAHRKLGHWHKAHRDLSK